MAEYLEIRRNLAAIVLLVDSRLGFTEIDRKLLDFVAPRIGNGSVKLLVLLTKIDKLEPARKTTRWPVAQATRGRRAVGDDESDLAVATLSALSGGG